MFKKFAKRNSYWLFLLVPIIATISITYKNFEGITLANLSSAYTTTPGLWIIDFVSISYLMFAFAFTRDEKNSKTESRIASKSALRVFWPVWFVLMCMTLTVTLIIYNQGTISGDLLLKYLLNHPVVIGLNLCIPLFIYLGFSIGRMFQIRQENRLKTLELKVQNDLFQSEIIERKNREKDLMEARKEALAGIKAKDQFLSNMSHEIRTPMNGVIGLTNLLLDTSLTKEQKKYATAIDYSAKNLLILINQILDLSKINSEKLTLEYIDFNVWETIQSVENTFSAITSEKGIVLRALIDPSVPKRACGDPLRLNQILMNLVGNAIKFTEDGGVDVIVHAKNTDDGPRLSIQVNDTGIGIAEDKLSSIFESFTQASDETTRVYGGSGLGLAITRELVSLYGGAVSVESKVGKGSSFSFDIQLRKEKGQANADTVKKATELKFDPKDIRILIAEDNAANQIVARTMLTKRGFQVDVAQNGQEVIELLYQNEYDLILMDVQMPIMGGHDATRFIRNATQPPLSEITIIALTASVMKEDIDKCMEVGMDDFLPKPFKPEEMFQKLAEYLNQKVGKKQ